MLGLGFFAVAQSAVVLLFTVWVLDINYVGSLWLVFVIAIVNYTAAFYQNAVTDSLPVKCC